MTDLMGRKELAAYLGVSEATLRRWEKEADAHWPVPPPRPFRLGRRIYFSRKAVEEWIEKCQKTGT